MITEWKDLEGRTIEKVVSTPFLGCVLFFKDGEYAHVDARGEERHGAHWPTLSDEDISMYLEENDSV